MGILRKFLDLFADAPSSPEEKAVDLLVDHGDGLPLLRMIVSGEIKWRSCGNTAHSESWALVIQNSVYYYLQIKRAGSTYMSYNLCPQEMSSALECAAINASRIGRATDCYSKLLR